VGVLGRCYGIFMPEQQMYMKMDLKAARQKMQGRMRVEQISAWHADIDPS